MDAVLVEHLWVWSHPSWLYPKAAAAGHGSVQYFHCDQSTNFTH